MFLEPWVGEKLSTEVYSFSEEVGKNSFLELVCPVIKLLKIFFRIRLVLKTFLNYYLTYINFRPGQKHHMFLMGQIRHMVSIWNLARGSPIYKCCITFITVPSGHPNHYLYITRFEDLMPNWIQKMSICPANCRS